MNKDSIEKGLTHSDAEERVRTVEQFKKEITPEQVERGLTDSEESVRRSFAWLFQEVLTPEQIERGLLDFSQDPPNIPCLLVNSPHVQLSDFQIERALSHENTVLKMFCARRTDFTPTKAQFDRGLSDVSFFVREAFVQRNDFRPTPEELSAMLNDRHFQVREAAQRKQVQMEMEALKGRHSEVLLAPTNVAAL